MHELPPLPVLAAGRYRHYKGGEYDVIGVARHSETHEPFVLYRPLYDDSGLWARPYTMFVEDVDVDGRPQPRFAPQADPVTAAAAAAGFDPVPFVQRQLDAYNARDLDRFVAAFTEDVVVFRHPVDAPFLVGRAALAAHYREHRFNLPSLHARLVARMVFGNKVIDHEQVTGIGDAPVALAAIYEVSPAGITRVWFVSGQ